jgi:hypothetical protein
MYNILQPYVNLTNANIEAFARFINAREIVDLTKHGAIKFLEVAQENAAKVAASDAVANLTRTAIDNYVRFVNEYTQQVYGIVLQGQEFVSRQMEEGNRRFAEIADISNRAVEAGVQSAKSAGDEAVNEADQQLSRGRQQRVK